LASNLYLFGSIADDHGRDSTWTSFDHQRARSAFTSSWTQRRWLLPSSAHADIMTREPSSTLRAHRADRRTRILMPARSSFHARRHGQACERIRALLHDIPRYLRDWQVQWLVERGIEIISKQAVISPTS
jgi:hypothetical protein